MLAQHVALPAVTSAGALSAAAVLLLLWVALGSCSQVAKQNLAMAYARHAITRFAAGACMS
jgi:hypothetical protein